MRRKLVFDENTVKTPSVSRRSGGGVKLAIAAVLLLVLAFGAFVGVVHAVVNKDEVAQHIYSALKTMTGSDVMAETVTLKVFPVPTVVLNNFVVANDHRSSTENILQVERVEVALTFASMADTKSAKLGTVTLINPVLNLDRYQDGGTNWEFASKSGAFKSLEFSVVRLVAKGGSVVFNDMFNARTIEFQNTLSDIKNTGSKQWNVNVQASVDSNVVSVSGTLGLDGLQDLQNFTVGMDMNIKQAAGDASYKGNVKRKDGVFRFDGAVAVNATDMMPWLKMVLDTTQKNNIFDNVKSAMPANIKADLTSTDSSQAVKSMQVQSGENKLMLDVTVDYAQQKPSIVLGVNAEKLSLYTLLPSADGVGVSSESVEAVLRTLLVPEVNAQLTMNVADFSMVKGVQGKLALTGDMSDGEFVLSQAQYDMAGEATLQLFGIAKVDAQKSATFEGNLEIEGKKFLDFTKTNGFGLGAVATEYNGPFQLKTMMSISHNQSIVSGLGASAGDLKLSGGLNFNNEDLLAIQGGLVVEGVNLDLLDAYLRSNNKAKEKAAFDNAPLFFDWLRDVQSKYALNLDIRHYIYNKKKHDSGKLALQVAPNKVTLSRMDLMLGDVGVKGDVQFDQTKEKPEINATLELSQLDISKFSGKTRVINPVPRGNRQQIWSKEVFDLTALQRFDGSFNVKISKLKHSVFNMDNVQVDIVAHEGRWDVKQLDGYLWDGTLQAQGSISFNAISSVSLAFTLQELPAERLLDAVAGLHGLEGPVSLSGQFAASGLNLADWMGSNKGAMTFRGHENTIKGFDLSGLVQMMPNVRTITDVNSKVRDSLLHNKTYVDTIEGSFSLENGVLQTNTLKMRSRDAVSTVAGTIDLGTWMMNMALQMKILTLARGDFPVVGIFFRDSMDNPDVSLDTRDIEAFVARRQTQ